MEKLFNGKKIRELRKKKFLSAYDLAQLIGTTSAIIYDYESNRIGISPKRIRLIAEALEVTIDDLIDKPEAEETPLAKKVVKEKNAWLESVIEKHHLERQRLMDQIETLTNMLSQQLGKLDGVNMLPLDRSYPTLKIAA